MVGILSVLGLFATVSTVSASYESNVNYGSPSIHNHHRFLGIDLPKVRARQTCPMAVDPSGLNFTHGIASGDPLCDRIILWTRVAPINGDTHNSTNTCQICVNYQISTDTSFTNCVATGQTSTSGDIDYTVKVDATGLSPFTVYYYRFSVCNSNNYSPVGRTKTAPLPNDTSVTELKFAVSKWLVLTFLIFRFTLARTMTLDILMHMVAQFGRIPSTMLYMLAITSMNTLSKNMVTQTPDVIRFRTKIR